jgi:hypothetical protein
MAAKAADHISRLAFRQRCHRELDVASFTNSNP